MLLTFAFFLKHADASSGWRYHTTFLLEKGYNTTQWNTFLFPAWLGEYARLLPFFWNLEGQITALGTWLLNLRIELYWISTDHTDHRHDALQLCFASLTIRYEPRGCRLISSDGIVVSSFPGVDTLNRRILYVDACEGLVDCSGSNRLRTMNSEFADR